MTMTNEKAIQILKDLKEDYDELEPEYRCVGFDKYDKIAIDMAIKALEPQPCEDMRDATEEERKSTKDYIDSISKPTGLQFDDIYEELDFVQPHKKISVNLQLCEDAISREEAINELKLAYHNKDMQSAKDDPCIVDAMTDWAIRTIKDLPSVTPKQPFINKPCISEGVCHEDKVNVLDKIKAEIEALSNANPSYTHTCDVVDRDDVLDIIDKYIEGGESE